MPITGNVFEMNEALEDSLETVNQDPYGAGWLIKVKLADNADASELISAEEYKELIGQ